MTLLARFVLVLGLTLLATSPALARGGRAGVESTDARDLLREHERVARRVSRMAPEGDARGRKLRERVLEAWEAARADALAVIFDLARYPDADHGRAGQALVDEKVAIVRAVGAELEALLRKDLAGAIGLTPAQATELLADALRVEARAAELALEVAPLPTGGLLVLAARAGAAFEVGAGHGGQSIGERAAPGAWERLLAQRARDVAVLQENEALLRARPAAGSAPSRDELEQARICNEYRLLMGRPALRLDARLVASARGHAQDMERLAFFDHESPVPGKRTATERMQAAGYPSPGGENIAMGHGSPRDAHEGWYRSSGHHRNMLSPDFTALGVGRAGTALWVQNFGS